MPRLIPAYHALVRHVYLSDMYEKLSPEEKNQCDEWLGRSEVKEYFGRRCVFQTTLHEHFMLAFANSDALHTKDRQEILEYAASPSFKRFVDRLEESIYNILRI